MAGYTSRFFLTLTIPSVFGFFSVLWLLRRKRPRKSVSKAIQVENSKSEDFENSFLTVNPMKLKSEEETCEGLQETETSHSQDANGIELNGKVNGKKSKSLPRGNASTCPNSSLTNGNDKEIELSNEIEAIDLNKNVSAKDEVLVHANNKTNSEMEIDDTNSPLTKVINGTLNASEIEQSTLHLEAAKDICDNNAQASTENILEQTDSTNRPSEQTDHDDDVCKSLTLSADCSGVKQMVLSGGEACYDRPDTRDFGKCPSENQFENSVCGEQVYEFEIIQELVGLLIGKKGKHVHYIKNMTNATIVIKRHPYFCQKKICAVSGNLEEIRAALKIIRKRFPAETYPSVTLSRTIPHNIQPYLGYSQLSMPEGTPFEACVCSVVTASHFFLQQPTHPTFHTLPSLARRMFEVYSGERNAPSLSYVDKGFICAAQTEAGWFRAEVDEVYEEIDQCRIKFLDYGGYSTVPRATLKQIRVDLMYLPFQATECYLANVVPPDGEIEWSVEAKLAFEDLAHGQLVQAIVVGYDDKIPVVHLYKFTGISSIFINKELESKGLAKWVPFE